MEWFNAWGLGFMAVIMVPNVVFMLKCPEGFQNTWQNKTIETLEQIGRFGCSGLMIFDIPGTCFGVPGAGAVRSAVGAFSVQRTHPPVCAADCRRPAVRPVPYFAQLQKCRRTAGQREGRDAGC